MSQTIVRSPIPFVRKDVGHGLSATRIKRGRLLLALCLFLSLGVAWFLMGLSPWQGWVLSDDAVTYLMATEPWRVQDLYFWRTVRFGSVFVSFWKLFPASLFGEDAFAFYLGHTLIVFAGMAFWWRAFSRPLTRILFVALTFPVSDFAVRHLLFPGHLYGMLFFLSGVFAYLLSRPMGLLSGAGMGILSALIYWQHQLAGLVVAGIFLGAWVGSRSSGMVMNVSSPGRSGRAFSFCFFGGVVLAEVARQAVKAWHVDTHYAFHGLNGFAANLWDLVGRGIPWGQSAFLGWLLAFSLVVAIWQLWSNRPRGAAWQEEDGGQSARQVAGAAWTFSGVLGLAMVVICFSVHYTRNLRSDRYFLFLIPFVLFFILKAIERAPRLMSVALATLVAFISLVYQGGQLFDGVLLPAHVEQREARWDGLQEKLDRMRAEGCGGYLGVNATDGYVFAALTSGSFLSSPGDYSRNPDYLNRLLKRNRICATMDKSHPILEARLESFACHSTPGGFRVCSPPSQDLDFSSLRSE